MIKLFVVLTIFIIALELEPATSKKNCVDKATNCKVQLQHENYCKHEDAEIRKFFLEQCQKSCGSCGDSSTGVCKNCDCWTCLNGGTCSVKNKNPTCKCPSGYSGSHCHFTEPCVDTSTKCAKFVPKYCTTNKFVMEKCKASCGICDPPTTAGPTTAGSTTGYPSTVPTTAGPTTAGSTTGYPSTDPTTAGPTTAGSTTGYPSTDPTTASPSIGDLSTLDPARKLCSARMMNLCRCGCKNAGPPEPKIKCNKKQKKICPCKCNNL